MTIRIVKYREFQVYNLELVTSAYSNCTVEPYNRPRHNRLLEKTDNMNCELFPSKFNSLTLQILRNSHRLDLDCFLRLSQHVFATLCILMPTACDRGRGYDDAIVTYSFLGKIIRC